MIDVDDYAPAYIRDQGPNVKMRAKKTKDISFGISNIADHGCGVIASYNVL